MTNPTPSPDHAEMAELNPGPVMIPNHIVDKVIRYMTMAMNSGCDSHDVRAIWKIALGQIARDLVALIPSESSPTGCEPDVHRSFKAICKLPDGDERARAFLWFSHGFACSNPGGDVEQLQAKYDESEHNWRLEVQKNLTAERTIAELESQLQRMRWMAFDGDNTITELRAKLQSAELTNQQLSEKCLRLVAENDLLRARTADQLLNRGS